MSGNLQPNRWYKLFLVHYAKLTPLKSGYVEVFSFLHAKRVREGKFKILALEEFGGQGMLTTKFLELRQPLPRGCGH